LLEVRFHLALLYSKNFCSDVSGDGTQRISGLVAYMTVCRVVLGGNLRDRRRAILRLELQALRKSRKTAVGVANYCLTLSFCQLAIIVTAALFGLLAFDSSFSFRLTVITALKSPW
jgi:hypothetical protein